MLVFSTVYLYRDIQRVLIYQIIRRLRNPHPFQLAALNGIKYWLEPHECSYWSQNSILRSMINHLYDRTAKIYTRSTQLLPRASSWNPYLSDWDQIKTQSSAGNGSRWLNFLKDFNCTSCLLGRNQKPNPWYISMLRSLYLNCRGTRLDAGHDPHQILY